ncbi:O-antigen ligase family protein [Candidatus Manganitrophus noduliformans]|uniref:O-antigen ligase family protein n=1 Tax=Candidatus Manganitrophus noduliformans TaxID=2606439 RepID=A0A7X6IC31_9BACT|nr:O-antigen ligase family protein [Candidatus Manganitrophus noduliformans]NKE72126.1 O-antigen ligase family protein [Candidatus Manganitrophus noduliformans]
MLFRLVLLYIVIFYSQIGGRVPILGKIRIEFLVGSLALCLILMRKLDRSRKAESGNQFNYAIIFFFISMLITIPISYWPGKSIETLIRVLKYFSIYIMIVSTVDTEEKLKQFVWTYLMMVFLIVGEPFLGVITGNATFGSHRGYDRLMGATGLWAHPNSLGGFASANLPFLYFLYKAENSKLKRWLILAIAVSSIGSIIFTGSRTAYVGVLGVVGAIWIVNPHKIRNIVLALFFLVVIWFVMPDDYRNQFLSLKSMDEVILSKDEAVDGSMMERWEIVRDAWMIFLDHPFLGVGVDAFPTVRGARFNRWQDTHNLYLQVLTNLGIIGGIAFFNLMVSIFKNLTRTKRHLETLGGRENIWLSQLAQAVTIFVLGRLIVGMFGMDLYENYWWFAGGLSVVMRRVASARALSESQHDVHSRPLAIASPKETL